ncbi:hypothetical protein Q666_09375 [Marinobacter sp. ES-1]|nr:hypothetical protein Q666_09375 [Marinobacter sp. ES-1]
MSAWLFRSSGRALLLKKLAYQASHDALTGLANRTMFEEKLQQDFTLARQNNRLMAVLFIDLDEFKPINDTLGHKVGDRLLVAVARALEACIRPTDTLARFGGDEFVVLLPDLESARQAEEVAERILQKIALPQQVGGHELYLSASIGISLLDDSETSPEKLIRQADMAMYKAKRQGRDTFQVYSAELDAKLSRRVTLRQDLQEAIRSGQLFLHYQPQVDQNGKFFGVEALVRWQHPTRGLIAPERFLPLAEETGQIVPLGKWIFTQACKDAVQLKEMGLLPGRMGVNLSPLQFHRPGFLDKLKKILAETGLPADLLELDLTEGVLMKDRCRAISLVNSLQELGISTAIDDFGTGFSSFSYLKDLPASSIKIDKSFVENVVTNHKDAAVCKGVITMAREMGLTVVAEGVEDEAQFDILRAWGCHRFQGFYFARPMALDALVSWAQEGG